MLPQIIYLMIVAVGLGIALVLHGKPRDGHSFWTQLISSVIALGLLYWGGFFDVFFAG